MTVTLALTVTPAQVDVAMGKAQAAMGRFEGSLVKQSDFIQDHMTLTPTLTVTVTVTLTLTLTLTLTPARTRCPRPSSS